MTTDSHHGGRTGHHNGRTGHQQTDSTHSSETRPGAVPPGRYPFESRTAECGALLIKAGLVLAILVAVVTLGTGGVVGATLTGEHPVQSTMKATQSIADPGERTTAGMAGIHEGVLVNAEIGNQQVNGAQSTHAQLTRDSITGERDTSPILASLVSEHSHLKPTDAGQYSVSALLTVIIFYWAVKGQGSAETSTGVSATTSREDSVSTTSPSKQTKQYVAFTLPSVLPLSKGVREVTHHELHAFELGLIVGGISAWLLSIGQTETVAGLVVTFLAGTLGFRRFSSKAFRTVRLEPWYALGALSIGAALGWAVFIL